MPPGPDHILPCSQRLVESRRQQILKEFEELHRRLDEEQQALFSQLEEEEQDILQRLRENAAHLGGKRRDVAHLAAEVEGKCLQSGFEMLKVRPLLRCSSLGQMQTSFVQATAVSLGCVLSYSTSRYVHGPCSRVGHLRFPPSLCPFRICMSGASVLAQWL